MPGIRAAVPDDPTALDYRSLFIDGISQYRSGRYEAAAVCFGRVVELKHDYAEAHLNLGLAHQKLSRFEDAEDCYVMALSFKPNYPEAHFNLGVLALEHGLIDDAAARFEEAVALKPDYAEALSNLGYVQSHYQDRLSEGSDNLHRAVVINPHLLDAHCNLALLLQRQGRVEEALAKFEEVLARDPSLDEARLNRALLLLAMGDFERGWPEYEARKKVSRHFNRRNFPYPDWTGPAAIGKTVLVYGEQGLGDEIMFASCLPDMMVSGARCVIDCSPKLERIFQRSFPSATVHGGPQQNADLGWLSAVPPIDCQTAIGSLPLYFRRSFGDFPRREGYLVADAARASRSRLRLDALGSGLKIGISWRGGTRYSNQALRSLALDELLPVLRTKNAHFISLQYTDCEAEITELRARHGITLHHWPETIDDYDETSALITALDLVISVQTAVVHLTGALGGRAWVLVPRIAEWRYLDRGEAMPWYPSVRLFRQERLGDWRPVIRRIGDELKALTAPCA